MRSRRLRAVLAAALAACASACSGSRAFVCPARGGPPWHEVASEHFLLRTDLHEEDARAIVREMEAVRAAMLAAAFGGEVPTGGRIEVVAFRSADELLPFSRQLDARGFAFSGDLGERVILLAESPDAPTSRLVAHEIAHVLSAHEVPRPPRWFAEGLAMLLEGIGERTLSGGRSLGSPPHDGPEFVAAALKPPVRDVLEWRQARWGNEELYARSFLLAHFLHAAQRPRFDALRARLARLENPRAAWNATFPEWSLDVPGAAERLDAALAVHARRPFARTRVAAPAAEVALSSRRLAPAEVHALRLRLPHRWTPEVERAEIEEALAEDPGHVAALAARARRREGSPAALARTAVAAHPQDAAAWQFLGESLGDADAAERLEAFRRAVALAPESVRARLLLARELGTRGELEETLALTTGALALAPWSASALLLHGRALAGLGRCVEAIAAGSRAVDVAVHSGPDAHRWAGEGVAHIEQACRDRAPAPRPEPAAAAAPRRPRR